MDGGGAPRLLEVVFCFLTFFSFFFLQVRTPNKITLICWQKLYFYVKVLVNAVKQKGSGYANHSDSKPKRRRRKDCH